MTIRYIVFEVNLLDSILQMEESIIAKSQTYGALMSWVAIDANSYKQTMTILGAFSAA